MAQALPLASAVAATLSLRPPQPPKARLTPATPSAAVHPARGLALLHPATPAAAAARIAARAARGAVSAAAAAAAAAAGDSENGTLRAQASEQQEGGEGGEPDPILEEARRRKAEWQLPEPTRTETILDILFVFGGLLDRPFGSGQSIAAAGRVVLARVQGEVEALRSEEGERSAAAVAAVRSGAATIPRSELGSLAVEGAGEEGEGRRAGAGKRQQVLFELVRVLQLLSVDMQMVGAAVKEETLLKRLDEAKSHCQLAMRLVNSL